MLVVCDWLTCYRTPLSTPSDVVIYSLAKAAKQHVGTVISGEGSDELLCGYEITHWSGHDYDAVATSGANNHRKVDPRLLRSIQKQYGRSRFQSETDHYFALNSLLPCELKPSMLSESVWERGRQRGVCTRVCRGLSC